MRDKYREEHRVKFRYVCYVFRVVRAFTYARILFNRSVLDEVIVLQDLHRPVPLKLLLLRL